MRFLKHLLGVKRSTSNACILRETGQLPLHFNWARCVLWFWNGLMWINSTPLRDHMGRTDLRLEGFSQCLHASGAGRQKSLTHCVKCQALMTSFLQSFRHPLCAAHCSELWMGSNACELVVAASGVDQSDKNCMSTKIAPRTDHNFALTPRVGLLLPRAAESSPCLLSPDKDACVLFRKSCSKSGKSENATAFISHYGASLRS